MSLVWIATLSLGGIGAISAIILYFVAQKFKVYEDPRNGQVEAVLPGANCGGCGYPGCGGFAAACVKADSLDGMLCPVGGAPVMAKIATILGMEVGEVTPKVAVVRCNGTCANRKKTSHYDGASTCAIEAALYSGETGCSYGCLGNGDCENACSFGAIHINPETRLPEVDDHLILAARAVHREPSRTDDGLPVFHAAGKAGPGAVLPYLAGERIEGFLLLLVPEPYAVEKGIVLLQGKVDMPGGGAGKVGHLAPYPDVRKAAFHRLPHLFRHLSYAEDGAHVSALRFLNPGLFAANAVQRCGFLPGR